jgi:hypothetical protein
VGICDRGPQLEQVVPDGIGGTLIRALYSIGNQFAMEARITRVHQGVVQFSNVVDDDQRITMIGDAGTAFLGGDDVRAVDVTSWNTLWLDTNVALVPVAQLLHGRFAMHDLSAGTLIEFSATGAPLQSVPFSGGFQTAPGLFARVGRSSAAATLSAEFSLPLAEEVNTFHLESAMSGSDSQQNGPKIPKARTPFLERTVMQLMRDLLVAPPQFNGTVRLEHSGQICREQNGQNYYYLYLGVGTNLNAIPPDISLCRSGTPVAFAHSHPRADDPSTKPSGFGSSAEYLDADPVKPDAQDSDLKIADDFYDNPIFGPQSVRHNFWWYVTAPTTPQSFAKYKKTSISAAKDNVSLYDHSDGLWKLIPALW